MSALQNVARNVAVLLLTTVGLTLSGCGDHGELSTGEIQMDDSGNSRLGLGVPDEILSARMVDVNQLRLEVSIGANDVPTVRNGNVWSGSFDLPGPGTHALSVRWFEQVGGRELQLAQSPPINLSSLSSRQLSITTYETNQFDDDGDRVSNLQERRDNTDPFNPQSVNQPTPLVGMDQTDCRVLTRTAMFPGFFVDSSNANFPTTVTVTNTSSLDFTVETNAGSLVYFEVYSITVPGTLVIRHVGGTLDVSGALLYDTDLNSELRLLGIEVDRATRAVVQDDVEPGVYCYRLESVVENTPVGTAEMRAEFTAR